MRAHGGARDANHEGREGVEARGVAWRGRDGRGGVCGGRGGRGKPAAEGVRLEGQAEHAREPEHRCDGDVLDLLRREWAAGRGAEALHPDVRRAVEEDDERLDRLRARRAAAPREAVPRPPDVGPRAEVAAEGEEAVAPEDAALCARACVSGRAAAERGGAAH